MEDDDAVPLPLPIRDSRKAHPAATEAAAPPPLALDDLWPLILFICLCWSMDYGMVVTGGDWIGLDLHG